MNEYTFDTLDIGLTESFKVNITANMLDSFKELSGDTNPMHMEDSYAHAHGYESRLVYGMLTASFYSRLAGMYLPGKYCILRSVEALFKSPVYVGDELEIVGTVMEKDERFGQATIKARVINADGRTVSRANIVVGFYE